ncbi:Chaperone surA [Gossypium australe]|uniref:Chaperone surA n=1 Tax=Gossypium australe TaxID=47621 RepID=A0A5B6X2J0_9ROSI|nr:Chaperone surA [Gossypium australe]
MDPDQASADDTASNALASAQGTAPVQSGPETREYARANPNAQPSPPLPIPQPVPVAPQAWPEEFRANIDDDPERAKFWLKNSMRVFDELSYTPEESLKCAVFLLRDSSYHWWKTLMLVFPKLRVTRDFFLEEL